MAQRRFTRTIVTLTILTLSIYAFVFAAITDHNPWASILAIGLCSIALGFGASKK